MAWCFRALLIALMTYLIVGAGHPVLIVNYVVILSAALYITSWNKILIHNSTRIIVRKRYFSYFDIDSYINYADIQSIDSKFTITYNLSITYEIGRKRIGFRKINILMKDGRYGEFHFFLVPKSMIEDFARNGQINLKKMPVPNNELG